jgi:hypothetical protein
VVFEVRGVADDDPREEADTMVRWRCPKLPGTAVRSDRRLAAVEHD